MKSFLKKLSRSFLYWTSVMVVATVLGVSLQFAKAWVEPGVNPPADNVGAPITTGTSAQTKNGSIGATRFETPNNGQGNLYLTTQTGSLPGYAASNYPTLKTDSTYMYLSAGGGYSGWINNGGIASSIFYDFNNGSYYVDPNGTSVMGTICTSGTCGATLTSDGTYIVASNYLRAPSGIYSQGWLESLGHTYLGWNGGGNRVYFSGNSANGLYNDGTYIKADTYLRAGSGIYSDGWIQSASATYAPIYYDGQNVNYYIDPNNTSRANYIVTDNAYSYGSTYSPITYDTNDSNYYVDSNGTSRINRVLFSNLTLQSSAWNVGYFYNISGDNTGSISCADGNDKLISCYGDGSSNADPSYNDGGTARRALLFVRPNAAGNRCECARTDPNENGRVEYICRRIWATCYSMP